MVSSLHKDSGASGIPRICSPSTISHARKAQTRREGGSRMARSEGSVPEFQPYVPADQAPPEFTAKAVILGSFFGLLFGAATVYLAIRAGLTVSASFHMDVLSI